MDLEKAIEFIKQKHAGQKRKQGTPYYTHPIAVANLLKDKGFPIDFQLAGLFHDLIEDTDATYEDIIALSNKEVAEAVRLVTKTDGYVMSEYIGNIKTNEMARMVNNCLLGRPMQMKSTLGRKIIVYGYKLSRRIYGFS